MTTPKRHDRFKNFCKLPLSIPKECLLLLNVLEEKGPSIHIGRPGNRGYILLSALKLMDQQTPYGWWDGPHLQIVPNSPPEESQSPRSYLRLVPPTTQTISAEGV